MPNKKRCQWCENTSIEKVYHDNEWGTPLYDDNKLFEFLCLEGAQAGLSWLTILKRRENYRLAFDAFDAKKIAQYDANKTESLMQDKGIIRNRLKINAFISNAKAFLLTQKEYGSFSNYLWGFLEGKVSIQNTWRTKEEIPAQTPLSEALSKDLKKRDFRFVGPVICYAYMQAIGMVNDHTTDCFRHEEVKKCNNC